MLEPYAVKVASTVLRRDGGSNLSPLFDYAEYFLNVIKGLKLIR